MNDYLNVFEISGYGMRLERARLETAALNIANANTTRPPGGAVFQPLRVLAHASPAAFEQALQVGATPGSPGSYEIVPATTQPRLVFDPGHPHADARGYVALPAINPLMEMTQLMAAVRAYEANVKAIEAARAMALRALEIGRS